jgi:N-acetyl-anhydromuramyl-L-alanine amidase AmpD
VTVKHRSPLAAQVVDLVPDKPRGRPVFGLVVHTSGRGIVAKAARAGVPVTEYCVGYYRAAEYSCHYLIGYEGEIVQITADDRRVLHVGVDKAERALYLSGRWRTDRRLASTAVQLWARAWARSPQHLFPSSAPNDDYVGVELPPLLKPSSDGLWYTPAQHRAVARLADDLRRRHGWPAFWDDVLPVPRLLGHEDLDAFGRWDRGGGWDPGALRAVPRFRWATVAAELSR